jgi:hypothetical protein
MSPIPTEKVEALISKIRSYCRGHCIQEEVEEMLQALRSDIACVTFGDEVAADTFLDRIESTFVQSRSQSGEQVGISSVLSLLVAEMQSMLSSHHSSGQGEKSTGWGSGAIQLKHLLYPKLNKSKGSMRIPLLISDTFECETRIRGAFAHCILSDVFLLADTAPLESMPSFLRHWALVHHQCLNVKDGDEQQSLLDMYTISPKLCVWPTERLYKEASVIGSVARILDPTSERVMHFLLDPLSLVINNVALCGLARILGESIINKQGLGSKSFHIMMNVCPAGGYIQMFIGLSWCDTMRSPIVNIATELGIQPPLSCGNVKELEAWVVRRYRQ